MLAPARFKDAALGILASPPRRLPAARRSFRFISRLSVQSEIRSRCVSPRSSAERYARTTNSYFDTANCCAIVTGCRGAAQAQPPAAAFLRIANAVERRVGDRGANMQIRP